MFENCSFEPRLWRGVGHHHQSYCSFLRVMTLSILISCRLLNQRTPSWPVVCLLPYGALKWQADDLGHLIQPPDWSSSARTVAQSSPSALTAGNQCTVYIGIFVHKTVVSCLQLGSPLVDDRPIMNAVTYRVVSGVVWTNRTMLSSNTDTNRTDLNVLTARNKYDGHVENIVSQQKAVTRLEATAHQLSYYTRGSLKFSQVPLKFYFQIPIRPIFSLSLRVSINAPFTLGAAGADAVSTLASHHCEPGSIPGWVTGFSHVGIVLDDAVGRRVFCGISPFPPLFHSGAAPYSLQSPSSALKTSLLRAAQISPSFLFAFHQLRYLIYSILLSETREVGNSRGRMRHIERCRTFKCHRVAELSFLGNRVLNVLKWLLASFFSKLFMLLGTAVVQWLGHSPPTAAIRARSPTGSPPDFRTWESCWTTPLAGGVFSGYSRFPHPCIPVSLHLRVSCHAMSGDDGHLRVPAGKPVTRRVLSHPGFTPRLRGSRVVSPIPKVNRVRFPAGPLPEFPMWEPCKTMPLVGGFSRGSPLISPSLHSGAARYITSPSSTLKTSLLTAAQISSFTHHSTVGSPLVDDRLVMNAVKYRIVFGVVWTNRMMVSSNTNTNRTDVLAVEDTESFWARQAAILPSLTLQVDGPAGGSPISAEGLRGVETISNAEGRDMVIRCRQLRVFTEGLKTISPLTPKPLLIDPSSTPRGATMADIVARASLESEGKHNAGIKRSRVLACLKSPCQGFDNYPLSRCSRAALSTADSSCIEGGPRTVVLSSCRRAEPPAAAGKVAPRATIALSLYSTFLTSSSIPWYVLFKTRLGWVKSLCSLLQRDAEQPPQEPATERLPLSRASRSPRLEHGVEYCRGTAGSGQAIGPEGDVAVPWAAKPSLKIAIEGVQQETNNNWAPVHNVCSVVVTPLRCRRATSCSYNNSHPVWHALYECLQDIHGDSSPFLLQPFHELSNGFWPRLTSPHLAIQFVPKMFYRVEVGALGGPVYSANIVVGVPLHNLTCVDFISEKERDTRNQCRHIQTETHFIRHSDYDWCNCSPSMFPLIVNEIHTIRFSSGLVQVLLSSLLSILELCRHSLLTPFRRFWTLKIFSSM
ncbi:hypothetical protein PR048_033142 [Dryococelus australis]|uniref:Uncharacterized protein n=1 Tax=Dryococelus australis TaxID=614101 RepID=A0ABQ9G0N6_9NEOP|nr:hypothetical protein PR048_033142 [Dryococelus australis]